MVSAKKVFITETPSVDIPILYGVKTSFDITLKKIDLFGYSLKFIVYKEINKPKILEIPFGENLRFLTYAEEGISKTKITVDISEAQSKLIPTIKSPALMLECRLIPTCFYDIIGTIGGADEQILRGFIQGTPTANGAI
jgi:hypothetical protein